MDTSPKKKIIIFSLVYIPEYVGGAEVAINQITHQTALQGYDFHMITLGKFGTPPRTIGTVTVHYTGLFGKGRILFLLSKSLFPFTSFFKYRKLQKANQYAVIWSLMANQAGIGAVFAKMSTPHVKLLLTLQEGDTVAHMRRSALLAGPFFKKLFVKADCIQCISHFLKEFAWSILGNRSDKVLVIPNGVDIALFDRAVPEETVAQIRKGYGFTEDDKVIVTTSRLTHKNGIDTLIDTVNLLPEQYKLLLIGAGPDESMLRDQVARLGLNNRVVFAGKKLFEDLYIYLKSSQVFVRLSRSEGFGNSFIEAMAARIPVVATHVGGIVDFIQDGENGLLVPPEDCKMARDAIIRAVETDTTVMVDTAYATAVGKYQWKDIGQSFDTLFKKI